MTGPYRESGSTELTVFAKHISIADTLLAVHADLRAQLATVEVPELRRSYLQTWGDAWEQLDQARAIIVRLGRDVSAYDTARAQAGDPHLVAAGMVGITDQMRASTDAAIRALRLCVPEVVVPAAPKTPAPAAAARPPERRSWVTPTVRGRIGMFIGVVLGGFIQWRCR